MESLSLPLTGLDSKVTPENGLEFWGNSFVADPFGSVIAEASDNEEEVLVIGMRSETDGRSAQELAFLSRPPHRRLCTHYETLACLK